jgi:molybdopterin-guanine dinucleotide biosynthesis protein A
VFDAIVLAGGSARRLGGIDKPALVVGGRALLDRALAAVAGARTRVVVGPRRLTADPDVVWCREEPPGGGPVAALAAGLAHVNAEVIVVIAADLPAVAPAVPTLIAALTDSAAGAALLTDPSGRINHLAAAWRRSALAAAMHAVGPPQGVAMRTLADGVDVVQVRDEGGWGRDCDTWDDLAAARAREGEPP